MRFKTICREERESRSREAAGRRNWPEAVPEKMSGRKRLAYRTRQTIDARGTNCRQRKAKKSRSCAPRRRTLESCAGASQARPGMVSRQSTAYPDEEQRDSTCVTTVPPKLPITAWGTACGDYFRVTTRKLARPLNTSAFTGTDRGLLRSVLGPRSPVPKCEAPGAPISVEEHTSTAPRSRKVRILRFKNLPPFRHYRGLQNHV